MAYNKSYSRINWENYPSDNTPINESNLNKMDLSIDEQDNRIVSLDVTKLNVTEANTLLKEIDYSESTGIFTLTYYNGTTKTIDTSIEKIATNFSFDRTTQEIVLDLIDGTQERIDISSFVSVNEFENSDTIAFSVVNDNVKANVIKGSITDEYLQPNYLADITVQANTSVNASLSAQTYMNDAYTYMNNAKQYSENANISSINAQQSSQSASQSVAKAEEVEKKADDLYADVQSAVTSASASALASSNSATESRQYAELSELKYNQTKEINNVAKSWAIGGTGTRSGEDTDNSKYYSEQSKDACDRAEIFSNKAEAYSNIVAPDFFLDEDNMTLYIKDGVGIDFLVDDNNVIYWKISA